MIAIFFAFWPHLSLYMAMALPMCLRDHLYKFFYICGSIIMEIASELYSI